MGNLEGELAALRTEKADLEKQLADTQTHATTLQGQLNELGDEKAQLDQVLADTQARLAETTGLLEAEQAAHQRLNEEHQQLSDTHLALQTEFGEREARMTRMQAEFAATETELHAAEEKLAAQAEESRRQLELVTKDLQAHKQALADTKGKLNATAQEKQRRETELKLELERRGEGMKSLETQVQVTKEQGMEGARDLADQMQREGKGRVLDQFANPDNPRAHYEGTGPEIWRDTGGTITHFVSSMGTTGTIMGTSRYLKEMNPKVQIVGVQPDGESSIPGIRKWPEEYLPRIFDRTRVDRVIESNSDNAENTMRLLASKEGLFCGPSSGGAVWAALQVCKEVENATLVAIICDRGDRYISTGVFPD